MDPVTTTPIIKAIRAMTAAISVDTFPCVTEVDLVSGTGVCCTLGDLVASPLNGDTGRPTGALGGTAESEEIKVGQIFVTCKKKKTHQWEFCLEMVKLLAS
jgi:hypothetical protein